MRVPCIVGRLYTNSGGLNWLGKGYCHGHLDYRLHDSVALQTFHPPFHILGVLVPLIGSLWSPLCYMETCVKSNDHPGPYCMTRRLDADLMCLHHLNELRMSKIELSFRQGITLVLSLQHHWCFSWTLVVKSSASKGTKSETHFFCFVGPFSLF